MGKLVSNKVFNKYHIFHSRNIVSKIEDAVHTSTEAEGVGYFINQLICEK